MTKLAMILSEDLSYNPEGKKAFLTEARAALKRVAKKLELKPSDFSISVNQAGIACSGEVTLKTSNIYVSVSQNSNKKILFRKAEPKSTNGGPNNWMSVEELESDKGISKLKLLA